MAASNVRDAGDAAVRRCLDWIEIGELTAGYNRAFDYGDQAAFGGVFVEDGVAVFRRGDEGDVTVRGREEIAKLASRPLGAQVHVTTDSVIEIDADEATQECTLLLVSRLLDENAVTLTVGRFRDRLRRTPEGWRFVRRECALDLGYESSMPIRAPMAAAPTGSDVTS